MNAAKPIKTREQTIYHTEIEVWYDSLGCALLLFSKQSFITDISKDKKKPLITEMPFRAPVSLVNIVLQVGQPFPLPAGIKFGVAKCMTSYRLPSKES